MGIRIIKLNLAGVLTLPPLHIAWFIPCHAYVSAPAFFYGRETMKLTDENYYSLEADRAYMSVSQFGKWSKCSAAEFARQAGEWEPNPGDEPVYFTVGKYVDNALTESQETFQQFIDDNKGLIISKSGKTKGQPKTDFRAADRMIERVRRDDAMMYLLDGEAQAIVTGEIHGVQWKGKLDILHRPMFFTDLKTTKDFGFAWVEKMLMGGKPVNTKVKWYDRYWRQMAVYQELCLQVYGEKLIPFIAAVTKEKVPDIDGIVFDNQRRLDFELNTGLMNLPHIIEIKTGQIPPEPCNHCDFCRERKVLDIESFTSAESSIELGVM